MKGVFFLVFLCLAAVFFFSELPIYGPLFEASSSPLSYDTQVALSQGYHYLGKGKQAFVFASEDDKWVIKFFNQKYFKIPFWASLFSKERAKRESRRKYYLESYRIAATMLQEETAVAYVHFGPSEVPLPQLELTDKISRKHRIDLNEVPFVLQRKAEPFYPALEFLSPEEVGIAVEQFLSIIAGRIDKKIGDGDHEVECNFGMLGGRVIHLDPGRLYFEERLWEPEKLKYEWWSATHRFRKWLQQHHPERISSFDSAIETNLQRVLLRSQASPSPQIDGSLQERSPAFSDMQVPLKPVGSVR